MTCIPDIDENGINRNLKVRYERDEIYVSIFLAYFAYIYIDLLLSYADLLRLRQLPKIILLTNLFTLPLSLAVSLSIILKSVRSMHLCVNDISLFLRGCSIFIFHSISGVSVNKSHLF